MASDGQGDGMDRRRRHTDAGPIDVSSKLDVQLRLDFVVCRGDDTPWSDIQSVACSVAVVAKLIQERVEM